MELKFKGKTALVTGAVGAIGKGLITVFAENGADLLLLDINEEKLIEAKAMAEAFGVRAETIVCDISNEADVTREIEKAEKLFGKIDFLINNAAVFQCWSPFLEIPMSEWKRFFDVNVFGTVNVTRAVLPGMLERGYGKIVNVASVAGHYGNANMSHYSATKGAIIAWSSALAKELVGKGITVNCVSPGTVSSVYDGDIDSYHQMDLCRLGRTGTGRENAELIAFLCTEGANYIIGQNILIDGCRSSI